MDELLFTPMGLLEILQNIDELSEYDLEVVETLDNRFQLKIGDSVYDIDTNDAAEIKVSDTVVEEVSEINDSVIAESQYAADMVGYDPINSGIIKEAAKTLLVGGLVRLTSKLLK